MREDIQTFRKDYFISIANNQIVVCKNPNQPIDGKTFEELEDISKRYLYEVGQKILTPFGIQTIKYIDKEHSSQHGYEWLIYVEENGNQYKPCELIGIVVFELDKNTENFSFTKMLVNSHYGA